MLANHTPSSAEPAGPLSCDLSRRQALGVLASAALSPVSDDRATPPSVLRTVGDRRRTGTNGAKERAASDYQNSLRATQGRLACDPIGLLEPRRTGSPFQFDVAIIGSGYGGSICAARLAEGLHPGKRLCVIERGREWIPGTFPDRFGDVTQESIRQLRGLDRQSIENPLGLFNLLQGDDVSVFSGSGLGGTSLINANVAIRPNRQVFQQTQWPSLLRDRAILDPYYDRAEWELGVEQEPIDSTDKMRVQRLAAEQLSDRGAHFEASHLTIQRNPQWDLPVLNRQGMVQRPCTNCGDCMSGCNVGAKNTLQMNYLPMARRAGAEIYTQTEVTRIEPMGEGYRIHFRYYPAGLRKPLAIEGSTTARIVIVAAGSLGSTELLMRSQSNRFEFSSRLGQSWSGNGDFLGFVHGIGVPSHIGGVGSGVYQASNPGPSIQGNITFPMADLPNQLCIQDGAAAKAFSNLISFFFRDLDLDRSHIFLTCGHDGNAGRIILDQGIPKIYWPNAKESAYRKMAENALKTLGARIGGEYRKVRLFNGRVVTVHPLGGCNMGDGSECGVVNDRCQVFANGCRDGAPHGLYPGLYVVDGAVIPTSLGVNPFATISAIAERASSLILQEPAYLDLFRSPKS